MRKTRRPIAITSRTELWGAVEEGHRCRCICHRQHCRCHREVALSSWCVGLRVCSIQRGVKWGWSWHGVNGVVVAQVGLWGGLGEGGLGLDRVATWVCRAIDSVIVVAQVGLWEVVEEGETGLGRAGPPARLSSLPSCGGISVVVFVGVGRCRRHIVPLRHDGVDDDAAVVASSRRCRSRRACMVLQVCSKRVGIGRAATRARFAVALRWWCRRRRAQWLRNARASLEEEEQCPRFKSSAN